MTKTRLDQVNTAISLVLAVCALIVTALVVRREYWPASARAASAALPPKDVRDVWPKLIGDGEALGDAAAPGTIVEFTDFQCPFCAAATSELREARRRLGPEVRVIIHHYPLTTIHPFALDAAAASECAGRQGRFEAYHDALFARQDSIGVKDWASFARTAGVADLGAFSRCVATGETRNAVQRDVLEGERLGVSGTPTFVVNGWLIRSSVTADTLVMYSRRPAGAAK
jgi:protein-disulfide isomerase